MWEMLFGFIGGLGLFLFGIQMMSSGMQKAAGNKLRHILEVLTSKPWMAAFTGIIVTFMVQSSSTTTVMVVGFANAGIMTLSQAVGTVIGSNVGTTLTAQIISFEIGFVALPAIGLGALLNFFGRRRFHKYIGQAILGFGLLFLGLITMSEGMAPLQDTGYFEQMVINFGQHPILGILVAAVFTALMQSSSATTGVIISLSLQDMLTFEAAVPLILGTNLGTCITAALAGLGTNLIARRTALAHILFNVIGIIIVFILLSPFSLIILETADTIPRQVANAHTIFNVFNTLVVLLFFNQFNRLVKRIMPGEEKEVEMGTKHLDRRILNTPEAALATARQEIIRMAKIAQEMVQDSMEAFINNDSKKIPQIHQMEELLDELEKEINYYISDLSQHSLTHDQSTMVSRLMYGINDIERIGDHAENIVQLAEARIEERLPFSEEALQELREMYELVDKMLDDAIVAFDQFDENMARRVILTDDDVDCMEKNLRKQHIKRINEKKCYPASGVVFLDVISNLERIGDHTTNIAESIFSEGL